MGVVYLLHGYFIVLYCTSVSIFLVTQCTIGHSETLHLELKKKRRLLFTLQITCELDSVSETAQRVHAVQHIWVQLSEGQDSPHTHSPGRRLLRARLIATTPGCHTHTSDMNIMCMIKYDVTSLEISIPFNGQVRKNEYILTDTRRVSGWSLAVRGDRADGAISFCSLLTARWPQSCTVL